MDPLADLLTPVRARTASFCRIVLDRPWSLRIDDGAVLGLATPLTGQAWVVPDVGDPRLLDAGDVAIVKGPAPCTIADHPSTRPLVHVGPNNRLTTMNGVDVTDQLKVGTRAAQPSGQGSTTLASGAYQVTGDVTDRLLAALPDIVVVPRADTPAPVMTFLADQMVTDGPAQQVVLDRLLDIALVSTLRAWFARPGAEPPGWYRAHSDPVAGPTLRLIHDEPAYPWTVTELARRVGTSRAALARRFTGLVGEPPISYLTGWRIALAADLLRTTNQTIEAIAHQVGYAGAFGLSVAFKRIRNLTPSQHRAGHSAA